MPARHYTKIAPTVQAICHKYNLAYNTGNFSTQFMQVLGRIRHFSKPSTEEWRAYKQSISNNNSINKPTYSNDLGEHSSQKATADDPSKRGFRMFLPHVVRQAMFYA